ncbi:MAG: hypothetical protein ABI431_05925 [Candidatus Tumulicola sp.]
MFVQALALSASIEGASAGSPPANFTIAHADYRFGYNTEASEAGPDSTLIVPGAAMADGGVLVSATDTWWNSVRFLATNSCEVYPNGNVTCLDRPYDLSPMQLVLFPMLGHQYFSRLGRSGDGNWTQSYRVSHGDLYLYDCQFVMRGSGALGGSNSIFAIDVNGKSDQVGGAYRGGELKQRIYYDVEVGLPAIVEDQRAHLPQTTIYNNDYVELRLIGASPA